MEAQIEKSEKCLGTCLFKWFGIGIGLGFVSSILLANVAIGMTLGLSLSFWSAIICKRVINENL